MHLFAPYSALPLQFTPENGALCSRSRKRFCARCCCDASVCDGVRRCFPQEINFHLPQILRLRRGTGVDSHVLPALPVTGPAHMSAKRHAWLSSMPSSNFWRPADVT